LPPFAKPYSLRQNVLVGLFVLGFLLLALGYVEKPPSSVVQVLLELQFFIPESLLGKMGNLIIIAAAILLVVSKRQKNQ